LHNLGEAVPYPLCGHVNALLDVVVAKLRPRLLLMLTKDFVGKVVAPCSKGASLHALEDPPSLLFVF